MSVFFKQPGEAGEADKNTDIETFITMHVNTLGRLGNTATTLSKMNKVVEPYARGLLNATAKAENIGHKLANALPFREEPEVTPTKGM